MTADQRRDAPAAIAVEGLECRHGERTVLRELTFEVREGELFFLVGGNGSGKSTLLRNVVGLDTPAAGTVAWFGEELTSARGAARRAILREFGVLFQGDALWSAMTVGDNVALPLRQHTDLCAADRDDVVALKLGQVGLAGCADLRPAELSGGMQKRAALARALALDPRVLLFDEPAAGLDPVRARELDRLIVETRDTFGTTVVVVTHDVERIRGLGDWALFLDADERRAIAEGPPDRLAEDHDDARVRRFFGGEDDR